MLSITHTILQHPYKDLEYTMPTSRLFLVQRMEEISALRTDSGVEGGWAGLSPPRPSQAPIISAGSIYKTISRLSRRQPQQHSDMKGVCVGSGNHKDSEAMLEIHKAAIIGAKSGMNRARRGW